MPDPVDTKPGQQLSLCADEAQKESLLPRAKKGRFRNLQQLSTSGFTILRPVRNAEGRVIDFVWIYGNEHIHNASSFNPASVIGRRLLEMFPYYRGSEFLETYIHVAETGQPRIFEAEYQPEDGATPTWFRVTVVPNGSEIAVLRQNITANKQKDKQLCQLNRTLRALTNVNQAMLHATDETALLQDVCNVIQRDCGYVIVWTGITEGDAERTLRPVACAGVEPSYFEVAGMGWDEETAHGGGPARIATSTRRPYCCRNISTAPEFAPWREQAEKHGVRSVLALPLLVGEKLLGTLVVDSCEADSFPEEEVKLLEELAADLAYGVSMLRLRTSHFLAEEATRRSRELLRVTLNSIGDGVLTTDTAGNITFLNPAAANLTGWTLQEAQGRSAKDIFRTVHETSGVPAEDVIALVLQNGCFLEQTADTALLTRDGRSIPIANTAAPIREGGAVIGVVVVFHDVTDRRRAIEALRQSEAKYRHLFGSIQEIVGVFKVVRDNNNSVVQRIVVDANPAFIRMAGAASLEEVRGKTTLEIFGPLLESSRNKTVQQAMESRQIINEEITHPVSGRNYITSIVPLDSDTYLNTGHDITERKQSELALLRSEKLASVGRMAATIAHEINNPLGAVTNIIYLASNVKDLPESVRLYLAMADEELKRVAHMTRQSLGFYHESNAPTPTSIPVILESVLALLKHRITTRSARIEKEWDQELTITAVAGELRQVFSNVLSNSLDALESHGTIRVRVSKHTISRSGRNTVRITVADNGKGIEADSLCRIFEPFFTTKGTLGLGLWVSKQIIEKHGGSIRVRSTTKQDHHGTVVSIFLPSDVAQPI